MALAETYANTLYYGNQCKRFWVHPNILVGGSILDSADWTHLMNDFGIKAVVNVEIEHFDREGKGIERVLETVVPDDGTPFPALLVFSAIQFAAAQLNDGLKIYVHCQMGGSRSPAFAYAILRAHYKMSKDEALAAIRAGHDELANYGEHPYHKAYLDSVETALLAL